MRQHATVTDEGQRRPAAPARVLMTLAVGLATAVAAQAQDAQPAEARLSWEDSYEKALERAAKEKKYVLLDFYTDWCGWCKRLDRDVFAKESFQKAAGQVIGVKINAEKNQANRALAQSFGVSSYPRLFMLDSQGRTLERIKGYKPLNEFTQLVDRVQSGNSEFQRLRAAAGDPNNLQAIHSFATFLVETKQLEDSIPYWQQVHDIALERLFSQPESTANQYFHRRALLNLGSAFSQAGLGDVGKQNLQEVTLTYAGTNEAAEAHLSLAQLEAKAGNVTEAQAHLQRLASDYPRTRANRASASLRNQLRAASGQ